LSTLTIISAIHTSNNDENLKPSKVKRDIEIEIVPLLSSKEYFTFSNPAIDRNNQEEFNNYQTFIEQLYRNDKSKDTQQEIEKHSYDSTKKQDKRSAQYEPAIQSPYYPETQDLFHNREPQISTSNVAQVSAYDSFLRNLYKFDKNKNSDFEVRKHLTKRDTSAVKEGLDQLKKTDRQGRVLLFRPLFVYRQQELKKQRYIEKKRQEQHLQVNTKKPVELPSYPPKKYQQSIHYLPILKGSDNKLYQSYDPYYTPYQYGQHSKPLQQKYYYPIDQ
jgi:hypothetical protein